MQRTNTTISINIPASDRETELKQKIKKEKKRHGND